MNDLINNFVNGNLVTARTQAKKYKLDSIVEEFETELGYSYEKSMKIALYLKNKGSFQSAVDAL
jgi:transcriptional regulatory protein LevR